MVSHGLCIPACDSAGQEKRRPVEILTLKKAQDLVREIIAENGGDEAKYEKVGLGCQYVHRFDGDGNGVLSRSPYIVTREWGCLVGRVLGKAGVPIEWFNTEREELFSRDLHVEPLRDQGILDIDKDSAYYLSSIQMIQDEGAPWVLADNYASGLVARGTEG
jgi:hypothetical protein